MRRLLSSAACPDPSPPVRLVVDGRDVEVPDDGGSLLDALRERLGVRTLKDGCSPQGQCGCCTVLVDGQPRVACVTPARRVRGRSITTLDGPRSRRAGGMGRGVLRHRRQPVRLLHDGHRDAALGAARQGHGPRRPPRGRAGAARPSVPLHRVAHDPRRLVGVRRAGTPAGGSAEPGPRSRRSPRQHRGTGAAAGRSRGAPRPRGVRRRHRSRRRPRGRARRCRRLGRGRIGRRGQGDRRQGAGPAHDRGVAPPPRAAARRLGRHPAHHLGGARLPRARRLVVRPRRRARVAAGQRGCVRREAGDGSHGRGPRAGRSARPPGAGTPRPGGRRPPGRQAATRRCRHARRRVGRHPGGADQRGRRRDRLGCARPGGRAGRRPGPADVVDAAGRRMGGGAGPPRSRRPSRRRRRTSGRRPRGPTVRATRPMSASGRRTAPSPAPTSYSARSPGSPWS